MTIEARVARTSFRNPSFVSAQGMSTGFPVPACRRPLRICDKTHPSAGVNDPGHSGSLIFDHGRECGVGRGLGVALGGAVAVGEGVGGMVSLGVGVGLGGTVAVAVAVAVAVGEGDAGTLGVGVGLGGIVPVGVGVGVVAPQGVALDAGVGEKVGVGGGVPTAVAIFTRPQPKTLFGGPSVPHSVDEIKTAELFKASRLG